jgi:hypothetical protein
LESSGTSWFKFPVTSDQQPDGVSLPNKPLSGVLYFNDAHFPHQSRGTMH